MRKCCRAIINLTTMCPASSMKFPLITILTALSLCAVNAYAGSSGSGAGAGKLRFSFSLLPIKSSNTLAGSSFSHNSLARQGVVSLKSSGLKAVTTVSTKHIRGGLSYLTGSAVENNLFAGWHNSTSEVGLGLRPVFILPCEYLDLYTSLHPRDSTGKKGLSLQGAYLLSPKLQINGAFLIAQSTVVKQSLNENGLVVAGDSAKKTNWQLDLGGAIRFSHNMTYSINFGYMDGGDIFTKGQTANLDGGSAYVVKHQLNMSF